MQMPALINQPRYLRGTIVYIPPGDISPNPSQPRKNFNPEGLDELCRSIRQHGILNPLSVRIRGSGYELIAGERRLRAARLAGLTEVPCVILDVDVEESGLLALVENLQRRDLDFIEEAEGISQLIRVFGMSQEEAARRLGKSQSAVANKLRLLKLPRDILERLRQFNLSERHGRALLRLSTGVEQRTALEYIIEHQLNVSAADAYIDKLLAQPQPVTRPLKSRFILKDVRVFLNSLNRSLDLMRQGGIQADIKKRETDSEMIVTIHIPKKNS